jgi:hypothetical protein
MAKTSYKKRIGRDKDLGSLLDVPATANNWVLDTRSLILHLAKGSERAA